MGKISGDAKKSYFNKIAEFKASIEEILEQEKKTLSCEGGDSP